LEREKEAGYEQLEEACHEGDRELSVEVTPTT
jgi:hypothetical protein